MGREGRGGRTSSACSCWELFVKGGAGQKNKGQIIVSPMTQSTYDLLVVDLPFVGVHESPFLNGNLRAF
jgi:hypothetical protein